MKYRKSYAFIAAAVLMLAVSGCGTAANYSDGTYEGRSSLHEGNAGGGDGYGIATVTVKDNRITECDFKTYMPDGTLKDEDYGKQDGAVANADFYNKAQRAVLASQKYGQELARAGELDKIDAISGATISYSEFKEAVADALSKAEK